MNLYAGLANLARYQPGKVAVETPRRQVTYAELDALSRRIAGGLRAAGAGAGDVVGLRLHDTPEHIAALFAVLRLGAIILPLDWRGTRVEYDRLVDEFRPGLVLDDSSPATGWPNSITLDATQAAPEDDGPVADAAGAPMGYSLTSGTTGRPAAMVVTHEQFHARLAARTIEGVFARTDRFLAVLPLAYPAGREHAICLVLLGATVVQCSALSTPAELVEFIRQREITATAFPPNMVRGLLEIAGEDGPLLPGLRHFTSVTSKLSPEERAQIRKSICPRMIDSYGSTGTGTVAIIDNAADGAEPTAVGRLVMGIEVEAVDESGMPLPEGVTGEIRVRGPAISTRAINASGDRREGFRDGWYYTGDLGRLDARGILHLDGRAADLIKRGGLMVYAQEVEQALRRHPLVSDAAVVGVPSQRLGQEVVAFVVTRSPADRKDIVRHCRQELAPFKIPSRIEFVDDLPRNASGKVDKSRLPATGT